jgi:hypothetical protein
VGVPNAVSVAASGSQWALAWTNPVGTQSRHVSCVSSQAPITVVMTDAGTGMDEISVAVTRLGGIGITVRDQNQGLGRMGASRTGCPGSYTLMQKAGIFPIYPTGVAATVLPNQTEVTDFRFATVDDGNSVSGTHGVTGFLIDGGVETAEYFQFRDPSFDISAAISGDGQSLMISYSGSAADGGYSLNGKAMPTDYTSPLLVGREILPEVRVWGSALCSGTCFVTTGVLRNSPVSLRASFITADNAYAELAGGTWDVACARSTAAKNAAPAVANGKLYVLYTDVARNELHVCDLPPGL